MSSAAPLGTLPQSFRDEQRELGQAGIHTWGALQQLSDQQLSQLCRSGRASARNLKRLRGMADLVCCLDLPPEDAALLMHAGIATVAALALPAVFDLSYAELILYATPGFVAFGAFALPAGWLADRWRRRGMMIVFFIRIGTSAMLTSARSSGPFSRVATSASASEGTT